MLPNLFPHKLVLKWPPLIFPFSLSLCDFSFNKEKWGTNDYTHFIQREKLINPYTCIKERTKLLSTWWYSNPKKHESWSSCRHPGFLFSNCNLYLPQPLCYEVCQFHWLAAGEWISQGTPVSSTSTIDCHNITENCWQWHQISTILNRYNNMKLR